MSVEHVVRQKQVRSAVGVDNRDSGATGRDDVFALDPDAEFVFGVGVYRDQLLPAGIVCETSVVEQRERPRSRVRNGVVNPGGNMIGRLGSPVAARGPTALLDGPITSQISIGQNRLH